MDPDELSRLIAAQLPYLRRFARALTGSQAAGDDCAAATLEAIVADSSIVDSTLDSKTALFRVFHAIWRSRGPWTEDPEEAEGPLAAKAQDRLCALTPGARVAVLLNCLESFETESVAAIMNIARDEAAELIEAGWRALGDQMSGRVLIIEDEAIIAMDLEAIVTDLGHAVAGVASTRSRALELATAERPNLVLADILLADGSSGIDAVKDILNAFTVPVIFVTAYPERLLTGKRPEPTFLITKPFKEEQVRAAIGQALFFESIGDAS